ncbi:cell wall anchor protein, partial [Streptomyces sp. 2MCAF27]
MSRENTHKLSRRGVLKAAGGLALAGAAGGITTAVTAGSADAAPATFTHPGMLHAYGELNRAKVRVAAGNDPW